MAPIIQSKFVIFFFNKLPENKESGKREENPKDAQDFPDAWHIWTVEHDAVLFDSAKLAEEYLKLQLAPNFLYRICSWKITLNHKVFSPVPHLIEVEEI